MNYFKSYYQPCFYPMGWYGTLDYAPKATILLYNDIENYCIGYMESELPNVPSIIPMSQEQALTEINNMQDNDGIWFGEKLTHRWDVIEEDGE